MHRDQHLRLCMYTNAYLTLKRTVFASLQIVHVLSKIIKKPRVLCTLYYLANCYGYVDWSATLLIRDDLTFLAVDVRFQNKICNQDGVTLFT